MAEALGDQVHRWPDDGITSDDLFRMGWQAALSFAHREVGDAESAFLEADARAAVLSSFMQARRLMFDAGREFALHQRAGEGEAADFQKLGAAFADLYSQALNGVVCDPAAEPGRHGCSSCLGAWKAGVEVLAKYDEKWGNLYRRGPSFQPAQHAGEPPTPDEGERLRAALSELVRLKDLKDAAKAEEWKLVSVPVHPRITWTPDEKKSAWDEARAALDAARPEGER